MTAKSKQLYPPFIWLNNKVGLVEDRNRKRWTRDQRRKLRHGNPAVPNDGK